MPQSNSGGHGSLAEELARRTGRNPACCYQCGKCSAGCPMAEETSLRPHDVMRLVNLDAREKLLSSDSIWLCLTCETCVARCPNQCDPARTIDALREMAIADERPVPRPIAAFHKSFLDQVRLTGRMFELGLMVEYKLRTGSFLADMTAAPGTVARGKLSFVPHAIGGVEEVRRIFERCEPSGEEGS
ncbi:MAG TPA: 4Fe-4S dicluster domain-containing protein [Thermoanaerobaculaceae bacterium]|nr:4Fe-4S dicluster domain-containing protein [Thermoanaerobaculaceae bacterium]